MLKRIVRALGKRGSLLLLIGLIEICHGADMWITQAPVIPDYAILSEYLPIGPRALLWIFFGVGATACGLRLTWQKAGWAVAIIMPVQQSAAYLWSLLMWAVPGPPPGSARSLLYAVLWALISYVIYLMSTWIEDPKTPQHAG